MKDEILKPHQRLVVGWREWVSLPDLGVSKIKAKIDSGAKTSAIHAWDIEPYTENGEKRVNFVLHPLQGEMETEINCSAVVLDQRKVRSSNGQEQDRWVIGTRLKMSKWNWPIELTLTRRDQMNFRMLIGRQAMGDHVFIDCEGSFLTKKPQIVVNEQ